jgi:hypothetical protein
MWIVLMAGTRRSLRSTPKNILSDKRSYALSNSALLMLGNWCIYTALTVSQCDDVLEKQAAFDLVFCET